MKKRDLLQLLLLICLSACTSDPTVPARTNTSSGNQAIAGAPDLSGLDGETRRSIEAACIGEFYQGPAPHRKCLKHHLESIGIISDNQLSDLDGDQHKPAVATHVENIWEFHIEGGGTPFEKRWAKTYPLTDESSSGSMIGFAAIRTVERNPVLYIGDPSPLAKVLFSALAGEGLVCDFDNWRLAVDRQEFRIADSLRSTDDSATFLLPQDAIAFWQAFVDGSLLAVQLERTCNGNMEEVTMVYSLNGSKAAVEYILD
ncbi:MAG: hypothetical protein KDH90_13225 [Anaerolineae bacterium]|nr:hypothetical protein [Anaerolineae bacterium]